MRPGPKAWPTGGVDGESQRANIEGRKARLSHCGTNSCLKFRDMNGPRARPAARAVGLEPIYSFCEDVFFANQRSLQSRSSPTFGRILLASAITVVVVRLLLHDRAPLRDGSSLRQPPQGHVWFLAQDEHQKLIAMAWVRADQNTRTLNKSSSGRHRPVAAQEELRDLHRHQQRRRDTRSRPAQSCR